MLSLDSIGRKWPDYGRHCELCEESGLPRSDFPISTEAACWVMKAPALFYVVGLDFPAGFYFIGRPARSAVGGWGGARVAGRATGAES